MSLVQGCEGTEMAPASFFQREGLQGGVKQEWILGLQRGQERQGRVEVVSAHLPTSLMATPLTSMPEPLAPSKGQLLLALSLCLPCHTPHLASSLAAAAKLTDCASSSLLRARSPAQATLGGAAPAPPFTHPANTAHPAAPSALSYLASSLVAAARLADCASSSFFRARCSPHPQLFSHPSPNIRHPAPSLTSPPP